MPTLAERSLRVALTGVVPDDDPSIIADMQAEIERLQSALDREEKYLHSLVNNPESGEVMHGDIEGAFHRIRAAKNE